MQENSEPGKKKKRGRPRFEPTLEQRAMVEEFYGLRVPEEKIAIALGVAVQTLRRVFKKEAQMGPAAVDANIAQSLYRKAVGNGPGASSVAIYLSQVWLGWRPPVTPLELTGKGGGPIEQRKEVVIRFLEPPQWPPDPPLELEANK